MDALSQTIQQTRAFLQSISSEMQQMGKAILTGCLQALGTYLDDLTSSPKSQDPKYIYSASLKCYIGAILFD